MVLNGMVRYGTIRYIILTGTAQYGIAWYGIDCRSDNPIISDKVTILIKRDGLRKYQSTVRFEVISVVMRNA